MWVESKVNMGSSFLFTIPVSSESFHRKTASLHPESVSDPIYEEVANVNPLIMENSASNTEGSVIKTNGEVLNILIVDDEPINHQVLKNHLSSESYRITQAMNGSDALKALDNGDKYNLVLLDVMMPKMTGYEVCQKIRKKFIPSELPVIMVTAKKPGTGSGTWT